MEKNEREFEELAERFVEAIKRIATKEENLENLQHYLSMHFEQWLERFAKTPLAITCELESFANMEI